jgi:hypothetical protein
MRKAVGTLSLALLLASVAAGEEERGEGLFRVEMADLDLGRITAGELATATFVFRNDSPSEVRILKAAPS